jgi:hypothetical protein
VDTNLFSRHWTKKGFSLPVNGKDWTQTSLSLSHTWYLQQHVPGNDTRYQKTLMLLSVEAEKSSRSEAQREITPPLWPPRVRTRWKLSKSQIFTNG